MFIVFTEATYVMTDEPPYSVHCTMYTYAHTHRYIFTVMTSSTPYRNGHRWSRAFLYLDVLRRTKNVQEYLPEQINPQRVYIYQRVRSSV